MASKVDELEKAVDGILDDFYGAAIEDIQAAAEAAGKQAAKELKSTSPGTKYPKGWKVKKEHTRTGASVIVYNDRYYMLAHLLEYGHPKVNGGRVAGQVHIQPVEQSAKKKFEDELKRRMESGT